MDIEKENPFSAFITNLGKYNEGELLAEWVTFPTTAEEMKKVFEHIGIGSRDGFGQVYEEYFITEYDCKVEGLSSVLGEYEKLDELNYLASKISELNEDEYMKFIAAITLGNNTGNINDLINLTDNLDKYEVYPDVMDLDDLGRLHIEEFGAFEVPEDLKPYIDYEAYGRDVDLNTIGIFTEHGYVCRTGESFTEYYDGNLKSIPEQYRLSQVPGGNPQQSADHVIRQMEPSQDNAVKIGSISYLSPNGEVVNTVDYYNPVQFQAKVEKDLQAGMAIKLIVNRDPTTWKEYMPREWVYRLDPKPKSYLIETIYPDKNPELAIQAPKLEVNGNPQQLADHVIGQMGKGNPAMPRPRGIEM